MKIKLHPLFFLVGLGSAVFGQLLPFIVCVMTALLHECGHIFCAERLGFHCQQISLMPYGATALCKIEGIRLWDEVRLALAGVFVNALLCIAVVALWWFYPMTYAYTDSIFYANLAMIVLNLLPAYPLDGSRVLTCLLEGLFGRKIAELVVRSVSFVLFVGMLISYVFTKNISLLFVSFCLLASLFTKSTQASIRPFCRPPKNGWEVKYILCDNQLTYQQALRFFSDRTFTILQYYDGDMLEEMTQNELYERLKTHSIYDRIFDERSQL